MRAESTFHVESAHGTGWDYGLVGGKLALASIDAHDLFLNSGSKNIFFRSVLLIIGYTPLPLILDHLILALEQLVILLLHFFHSLQELLPQTFVVLFQKSIFPFDV